MVFDANQQFLMQTVASVGSNVKMTFLYTVCMLQPTVVWSESMVPDANRQFLMLTAGSNVKMTFIHTVCYSPQLCGQSPWYLMLTGSF